MTKYALLIYTEEDQDMTPEQQKAEMDGYWAFTEMLTETKKGDAGEALHHTSTATTVRVREGRTLTTDGPFMETKEALGGFYLLDAADLDEAIALAAKCPGAGNGSIELRPLVDWAADGSPEPLASAG